MAKKKPNPARGKERADPLTSADGEGTEFSKIVCQKHSRVNMATIKCREKISARETNIVKTKNKRNEKGNSKETRCQRATSARGCMSDCSSVGLKGAYRRAKTVSVGL